jgi:hypothetical protein
MRVVTGMRRRAPAHRLVNHVDDMKFSSAAATSVRWCGGAIGATLRSRFFQDSGVEVGHRNARTPAVI